jgi:aminopeptidase N
MSFHSLFTRRAVVIAAIFATILAVSAQLGIAQRLPAAVVPEHYTLTLTPDLKAATFSGVESIDVTIKVPTQTVTLNAAEIAFQTVTVSAAGHLQTASVSLDEEKEQATFTVAEPIPAGKATLSIRYTGILNNELRGFYLSKTTKRNYAVTQFEPTDARRAFPCFDEPALKATFDISLLIDATDTAISNGPIVADAPGPDAGKHTLKFLTTPRMSTYLVAFLVGDFRCTSGTQDGVQIRVCSTPDKIALTTYGEDVAKHVLHYYNNYFGIPYPLKKLDLIGIPDFEAGAMENFGAITYRDALLLIDPKNASDGSKENVALVIAHEMAHQWFGDLVTMQWWDNLWLNEGFATWMENKAVNSMHPEWNIDQIVADSEDGTLGLDAQPTTRAIRAKAETPDQINQLFDGIAYGKASDVLLTVENYVGAETFRQGVHNYLTAHLYANATAEDFWNAQTATSHKPVNKIMDSLVAQPGVPILTFGTPADGKVSVEQKRFYLSPSIQPNPAQKWTIPVCFKTATSQDCQLVTPTTSTLTVPTAHIFFANAAGKGYYRSSYPPEVYAKLISTIETSLTPPERINLAGDEWALVRANKATVGDYLNLSATLKDDTNTTVVSSVLGGIGAIYERVAATPEEQTALAAWIRQTYAPAYKHLGEPSAVDTANTRQLRSALFSMLGYYGKDPAVLSEASSVAGKYIEDTSSVDPTFGETALAIAARNGDAKLFDRLQHLYEVTTDPAVQQTALHLLAQFEDPALVERSLQFAIALGTPTIRDQAWRYIKNNWPSVQTQLTTSMGASLVSATGGFCSVEARDDVRNFFSTHKVAATDVALRHALERIDGCIEFRNLQEPNLEKWMAEQTSY